MTDKPFTYRAKLDRVVDGDTFDVVVDLGFNLKRKIRLRLAGVDTAEIFGVEKESDEYGAGIEQKKLAEAWFDAAEENHDGEWYLMVSTSKTGKYGRYLAEVRGASEVKTGSGGVYEGFRRSLADELISQYPGVRSE